MKLTATVRRLFAVGFMAGIGTVGVRESDGVPRPFMKAFRNVAAAQGGVLASIKAGDKDRRSVQRGVTVC